MATVSKEFRIGALVIGGLILLILGVNYLKGFNPFQPSNTYYAAYSAIDGLAVSNPVVVNGFKVGQVTEVAFSDEGDGSLMVAFKMNNPHFGFPVTPEPKSFPATFSEPKPLT